MNRLVIIGNGFDLAHGLPTSYSHFINDFWKNFRMNCKSYEYQKLVFTNNAYDGYYSGYNPIENFNDFKSNLKLDAKEYGHSLDLINLVCKRQNDIVFKFNNDFFRFICDNSIENWVDIENEYYIDEFVFDDDVLLTGAKRKALENRGGSGVHFVSLPRGLGH